MKNTTTHTVRQSSSEARDRAIGRALVTELDRRGSTESCITPEELAACLDSSLSEKERDRVMGHLSGCSRCYQVFTLAGEMRQSEQTGDSSRRTGWYMISGLAAAAAVAALVIRLTVAGPEQKQQVAQQVARPLAVAVQNPPSDAPSPAPPAPKPLLAQRLPLEKKSASGALQLISPEEAALPDAKTFGFSGRAVSGGPEITVESPLEGAEQSSAINLRITFTPHDTEIVALSTLKLEYLKQTPLDLTLRIKPFASGNGVSANKVKLPPGLHRFRVSITDSSGRFSEKDFTVLVSGAF
jgi:hypothetical protein